MEKNKKNKMSYKFLSVSALSFLMLANTIDQDLLSGNKTQDQLQADFTAGGYFDDGYFKHVGENFSLEFGDKATSDSDAVKFYAEPFIKENDSNWHNENSKMIEFSLNETSDSQDGQTVAEKIENNSWWNKLGNWAGNILGLNEQNSSLKIDGNKIVREEVFPGVDLNYQILDGKGLKEELILKGTKDIADTYWFDMNLDNGIKWQKVDENNNSFNLPGNTYYFTDENGNYLAHFLPIKVYDANGSVCDNTQLDISADSNDPTKAKIKLSVDNSWLFNSDRQYPVVIDPSIVQDSQSVFNNGKVLNRVETTSANRIQIRNKELAADQYTVGLWHMNETSGTSVTDNSRSSNNGTATGTTIVDGKINKARSFNGTTSDYITAPDSENYNLSSTDGAVEFWIKPAAMPSSTAHLVSQTYNTQDWTIYVKSTGSIAVGRAGVNEIASATGVITINNWYHVVVNKSSGTTTIYVNGNQVASNTTAVWNNSSQNLRIGGGQYSSTNYYFNGIIDELRFVKGRALTAEEIKADGQFSSYGAYSSSVIDLNYDTPEFNNFSWSENGVGTGDGETPFSTANLVAQWNFNETSGTTASSGGTCGSSCDGTLTNMTTSGQDASAISGWTANNKRWGTGALMFDGGDDYASVNNNSDLNFERTNSFSIDTWIKINSLNAYGNIIGKNDSSYKGWNLMSMASSDSNRPNSICLMLTSTNSSNDLLACTPSNSIQAGTWYHIVSTYSGNSDVSGVKMYLNGTSQTVTAIRNGLTASIQTTSPTWIGRHYYGSGSYPFNGTIDSLKVFNRVLSTDEITSNLQAGNVEFLTRTGTTANPDDGTWEDWKPASSGTETQILSEDSASPNNDAYTKLLIHGNGINGSTVISDSSRNPKSITSNNSTATSTTQSKFDGSSVAFNGTNQYLSLADSEDFNFANGNFSIDFWVYFNSLPTDDYTILSTQFQDWSNRMNLYWDNRNSQSNPGLQFGVIDQSTGVSQTSGGAGSWSTSTWYHVAIIRTGNTLNMYRDGVLIGTNSYSQTYPNYSGQYTIGGELNEGHYLNGYIDEYRISKGTARWTSAFTPPNSEYHTWINTSNDSVVKAEGTASEKINYSSSSVDANTVGLWRFEETGGSGAYLKDSSINSNNGTPTGTSLIDGISGKARSFNGSSDYVDIGTATPSSDMTIETWVKISALPASNMDASFVTYCTSGGTGYDGFYIFNASGTYYIYYSIDNNSSNRRYWRTAYTPALNTWYHMAVTQSGPTSTPNVYINGVAQSMTLNMTAGTPSRVSATLALGRAGAFNGAYFNGSLDEVKISNVVRTADEIAEAYRLGRDHYIDRTFTNTDLSSKNKLAFYVAADRPGSYLNAMIGESAFANYQSDSNTAGLWHLEEATGSSAYLKDSSGNANNATPTGTTLVDGKIGKSRSFNGTSDYISAPDSASLDFGTGDFAVSLWLKIPSSATSRSVIGNRTSSGTDDHFNLEFYTTANRLEWHTSLSIVGTSVSTIPVNEWTHVVVTRTSGVDKFYINGANTSNFSDTYNYNNGGNFYIGKDGCAGCGLSNFSGQIDEVQIRKNSLSADEIRQAYEIGLRTHPITIDFGAGLDSGNLITNSSDTSFTIDATKKGLSSKASNLFVGDKIIVKENYDGTEYIAQGNVNSVDTSTGAVTINSWDGGSTFPSSGFSINADVFKWQREYFDLTGSLSTQRDAINRLTVRLINGAEGRNIWLDDFKSIGNYLTNPSSNTIASTPHRYFQYKFIPTTTNTFATPSVSNVTLNYTTDQQYSTQDTFGQFSNSQTQNRSIVKIGPNVEIDLGQDDPGNGADGALTVSSGTFNINTQTNGNNGRTLADAVNFTVTSNTAVDQNQITLSTAPNGLAIDDEVIIINLQGSSENFSHVGEYETKRITGISSNTLTLDSNLKYGYDGATQKIMVQRVPNYTNLTVATGTILTADAWDGTHGGLMFVRANGTVSIVGSVNMNAKGYYGAQPNAAITDNGNQNANGNSGESYAGAGSRSTSETNNGGAGGGGAIYYQGVNYPSGAGGGSYATAGERGITWTGGSNTPLFYGGGGSVYGYDALNKLYLGSGGGSGGSDTSESNGTGGRGGYGGGIVRIASGVINVTGSVVANGENGQNHTGNYAAGGGGGSGGSVKLNFSSGTLGTSLVTATGGSRSTGAYGGSNGGAGGSGRISAIGTITGTTSPTNFNPTYKSDYSVYDSTIMDLGTGPHNINNISWTEKGVRTGNGETPYSTTGLVAQWNFNETSGTTATNNAGSCGSACNGTLTNMTTTGQDAAVNSGWTANNKKWGTGAVMFDGSNDYVSLADNLSLNSTNFSLETWFKVNQLPTTYASNVIMKGRDNLANSYYLRIESSDKKMYFVIKDLGNTSHYISTQDSVVVGQWYHVVGTWDGTNQKLYLNGVLQSQSSVAFTKGTANSDLFTFGKQNITGSEYYFNGSIDSTRLYSRALSADEIQSNYQAGNVELQTRTGSTGTPDNTNWEAWKPAGTGFENSIFSLDGDQTNWNWDSLATYAPKNKSDDNVIKIEGASALSVNTGTVSGDANTVGLWHLNEISGTGSYLKDSSGNNNDATPSGTTVIDGIDAKARNFNGTSDYVIITNPSASIRSGGTKTVSAWIKTNNTTGVIFSSSDTNGYQLYIDPSGNLNLWSNGGGSLVSTTKVNDGLWHHVVATWNGTTAYIYSDGIQVASGARTIATNSTTENQIGVQCSGTCPTGASYYFKGIIDEVKVDNIYRSAGEIAEAYRLGRDHRLTRTLSSNIDLSDKSRIAFYVAGDKIGNYSEITMGESAFANYEPDGNTVGLWHLDDVGNTTGSIKDSSSNGNNGTPTGTTLVDGKIGKGRSFNGSSEFVIVPNNDSLKPQNEISISAWVYPTSLSGMKMIVEKWTNGSGYGYGLYTSDNTINGEFGAVSGNTCAASSSKISTSEWQHFVYTYKRSDGKCRLFKNGILISEATQTGNPTNSSNVDLGIGRRGDAASNYFTGSIDEVRIDNAARTPDEIRQSYEYSKRTHAINIDFAAILDSSSNTINDSTDLDLTVNAITKGLDKMAANLYTEDKLIIKETIEGTTYSAQGTVGSVNTYSGVVHVNSWDSGSTFPSSGYTTNADVFKWQREYWDATGSLSTHRDAINRFTIRFTDGSTSHNMWLDDFKSINSYLTNPAGSTIYSSDNRYWQYRIISTTTDTNVSPSVSAVTLNYVSTLTIKGGSSPAYINNFNKNSYPISVYGVTMSNVGNTITSQASFDQSTWHDLDNTTSPVSDITLVATPDMTAWSDWPTSDGQKTVYVRAKTNIGSYSGVKNYLVTKDTVDPVVTINSVAGDTSVPYFDPTNNSNTIVNLNTPTDTASCRWNESDVSYPAMTHDCESASSCSLNYSGFGAHAAYVSCQDQAGNISNPTTQVNYTVGGVGQITSANTTEAYLNYENRKNLPISIIGVTANEAGQTVVVQGSWDQTDWNDFTSTVTPVNDLTMSGNADVTTWDNYPGDDPVNDGVKIIYIRVIMPGVNESNVVSFPIEKYMVIPYVTSITSVAGDTVSPYSDRTNDNSTLVVYSTSADASACRWSETDISYPAMTNNCESLTNCTLNVTGLGDKTVYLRCENNRGNYTTDSLKYEINYHVGGVADITGVASNSHSIPTINQIGFGKDGDFVLNPVTNTTYNLNSIADWPGGLSNALAVKFRRNNAADETYFGRAGDNKIVIDGTSAAGLTANSACATNDAANSSDEILIINLQGISSDYANVGKYETHYLKSITTNSPAGKTTLELCDNLTNDWDATTQKILVQRVPQFKNLTIGGANAGSATLTTDDWNGGDTVTNMGGVMFFRVSGKLLVEADGSINMNSKGYRGAPKYSSSSDYAWGYIGESEGIGYQALRQQNGIGSGGGGGNGQAGGGGGGYGTVGTAGVSSGCTSGGGGTAGAIKGQNNLSVLSFGGSGGASGSHSGGGRIGAVGGKSGGIIGIFSDDLQLNSTSTISANGANGEDGYYASSADQPMGGGGGGAGGSILIKSNTISSSANITATGGTGGIANSQGGGCTPSGAGGNSGTGRVAIFYGSSNNATSNPAAYLQQITLTDKTILNNENKNDFNMQTLGVTAQETGYTLYLQGSWDYTNDNNDANDTWYDISTVATPVTNYTFSGNADVTGWTGYPGNSTTSDGNKSIFLRVNLPSSNITNIVALNVEKYMTIPTFDSIVSVAGDDIVPYYDTTNNNSTLIAYTASTDASICRWSETDLSYPGMVNTCETTSNCTLDLANFGAKDIYFRCRNPKGNNSILPYHLNYNIGGISIHHASTSQTDLNNLNKNAFNIQCNGVIAEESGQDVTCQGSWNQNDWYDVTTAAAPLPNNLLEGQVDVTSWNDYPTDGNVTMYVRATNKAGYTSHTKTFSLSKDTIDPVIFGIVSVASDYAPPYYDPTNNKSTVVISSNSGDTQMCKWDLEDKDVDLMANSCENSNTCDINLEGKGAHSVWVGCKDIHGNKSNHQQVNYTISVVRPQPIGWRQTREIKIDPATPTTNQVIRVELNPNNFDYDNARQGGASVKFYDRADGKLLDYWLETWDDMGTSVFWVKIPQANTDHAYMYYGNSSGISEANFENVFSKNYSESGLLGLWHLDEATGIIAADISGNNKNLTLTNGPLWQSEDGGQWANSESTKFGSGSALGFDGQNDYAVSSANLGLSGDTSFTMCSWIKWTGTIWSNDYAGIMGNNSTNVENQGLSLTIKNGQPALDFWNRRWRATSSLPVNKWYFICATKTPGNISTTSTIYVNGQIVSAALEGTDGTPNITDSSAIIGRADSTRNFTGIIDEARVYNRALSANEIRALFERREYNSTSSVATLGGIRPETENYSSQTDWMNTAWQSRARLHVFNLENANELSNYQVLFNVDTKFMVQEGLLKTDAGDLRFTDTDGVTQLSYFVQSGINNIDTKIFVRIPNIPANDKKSIYMYYKNTGATSSSDSSILTFYDDFEDGVIDSAKWPTQTPDIYLTETGGQLKMTGVRAGNYYIQSPAFVGSNTLPLLVEAQTSTLSAPANGWTPLSWWRNTSSGMAIIDGSGLGGGKQTFWSNGRSTEMGQNKPIGESHLEKIILSDYLNLTMKTNYQQGYFANWSRTNIDGSSGTNYIRIGARPDNYDPGSVQAMDGRLDWVLARKYTYPEPRVGAYKLGYSIKQGDVGTETWSGTVYVENPVTLLSGATITIDPGTTVKFAQDAYIINENGNIVAEGTALEPIYFTGSNDDSVGALIDDSNGAAAAGSWQGVYAIGNGKAIFAFCNFNYGGALLSYNGQTYRGMINDYEAEMTVVNTVFNNSANADVFIKKASPFISRNNLGDSPYGLYIDADNTIVAQPIEYNSFENTTSAAVYVDNLPDTNDGTGPGLVLRNNDINETNTGFFIQNPAGSAIRGNNAENTVDARRNAFVNNSSYLCYFDSSAGNCKFDRTDGGQILFDTNSIVVTAPNGGEALMAGENTTLTWNFHNGESNGDHMDIFYSNDSGAEFDQTIATGLKCDGSSTGSGCNGSSGTYTWRVANDIGDQLRIKTIMRDSSNNSLVEDISDRDYYVKLITDELSDGFTSSAAIHKIKLAIASDRDAVTDGSIKITFPDEFDLSVAAADVSASGGDVSWSTSEIVSGQTITFPFTGTLDSNDAQIILTIGQGANQVINPIAEGSYRIVATIYNNNSGSEPAINRMATNVVIANGVGFGINVASVVEFSIRDEFDQTTIDRLSFGQLAVGTAKEVSHAIKVSTNSYNGYTVTVQESNPLANANGDTIPDFVGTNATPLPWTTPPTNISGYYGYHTSAATLGTGIANRFAFSDKWAAVTGIPQEIAYSDHMVRNDLTTMTYKLQVRPTQANGYYEQTVQYICIPKF